MWGSTWLRSTHVLRLMNRGVDLLSRGNPIYGEWTQMWLRYRQAAIDLFTSRENTQCPLLFSQVGEDAPLYGCSSPPMARLVTVHIPPAEPHRANTSEGEGIQTFTDSDCTVLVREIVGSGDNPTSIQPALASPLRQRGRWRDISSCPS